MEMTTYSAEYLAESRVTLLNVFYSIPIVLETLSTTMRLWAKETSPTSSRLAFDDYLMVLATCVAVAECISGLVYGPPNGLGRHVQALSAEQLQTFGKGDFIFSHLYDVAITTTKLSVLALYYRIFGAAPVFRAAIIATASFVVLWLLTMELVLGLMCQPVEAWWGAATGICINRVAFGYFTNVTNLVTDMWIFIMPIPIIMGLQATKQKRLTFCFLFSIGLGTCAISAARLTFVFSQASADVTWWEVDLGILSAWEPCGGILCANLPVIYPTIVKSFKYIRTSVSRSSRQKTGNSADSQGRPAAFDEGRYQHGFSRLNNSRDGSRGSTSVRPRPAGGIDGDGHEMRPSGSPSAKVKDRF